jgi:hypothetical protein
MLDYPFYQSGRPLAHRHENASALTRRRAFEKPLLEKHRNKGDPFKKAFDLLLSYDLQLVSHKAAC